MDKSRANGTFNEQYQKVIIGDTINTLQDRRKTRIEKKKKKGLEKELL